MKSTPPAASSGSPNSMPPPSSPSPRRIVDRDAERIAYLEDKVREGKRDKKYLHCAICVLLVVMLLLMLSNYRQFY